VRSIFVERKDGQMELRRGFNVDKNEKVLICEDIITTGGSALEAANIITKLGATVVGFSALANRGFCHRENASTIAKSECKLPKELPLFALADFEFAMYSPDKCPMCASGDQAIKPGSRGN
jgi:orotate phosphoribosyltransferase